MSNTSVLVVAFDGLDYELIKEYGLKNIPQNEFGRIDNATGINSKMTSELFTSFITGKTWKHHGVKGLRIRQLEIPKWLQVFDQLLDKTVIGSKTSELRNTLYDSIRSVTFTHRKYLKQDFEVETVFDKVASLPVHVPVYNYDPAWLLKMPHGLLENGLSVEDSVKAGHRNTEKRLNDFDSISYGFWPLVMLHIHEPDAAQDLRYSNLEEEYRRVDRIAGDIIEGYAEHYDTIIFVSDHGLSEQGEHNRNAFYSCNHKLFGEKKPHITSFYYKIMGLLGEDAAASIHEKPVELVEAKNYGYK